MFFFRFAYVVTTLLFVSSNVAPVSARNISVVVGGLAGAVLNIVPNQVKASVGDMIVFEFRQKNHTMTQSSFSKPCTATSGGFDTGFLPVPQNQTSSFPIKTFVVEKTDPYWMYCAQATHCQEGMVFAINPGNNFSSFQENALALAAPSTMTTVTSTVTVENAGQTVTVTVTSQSSPTGSNSTTASDASSSSANLSKNGAKALVVDGSTVSVLVSVLALMLGTVM